MRLLVVAEDMPNRDPVYGDGSSLISLQVVLRLAGTARVTMVTFAGPVELPDDVSDACAETYVLPLRHRRPSVLGAPLTGHSIGAFQRWSSANRRIVRRLSAAADVALIHGPQALPAAFDVVCPLAIQSVDPWSMRVAMEARMATGVRGAYLGHRSRQSLRLERRLPARARLMTVSQRDATQWSALLGRPVRAVPNGVERPRVSARVDRGSPTVCFVGSLNYGPNIESAERLVRDIAPLIWARVPECRIIVAGRQPVQRVLDLVAPRVEIVADVPSMAAVFAGADVALFPDRFGLGVRNSVAEAVAAGLHVVASPVAAREIERSPRLHIAADDAELADLTVRALRAGPGVTGPGAGPAPCRTWDAAVADYREELDAAAAGVATSARDGQA